MKILVIHSSSDLYGSDRSLLDLLSHANKDEFSFDVVLPNDGPLVHKLESLGIRVFIGPTGKIASKMLSLSGAFSALFGIFSSIKFLAQLQSVNKYDLVYSNTIAVYGGAVFSRLFGIPHLWHVREIVDHSKTVSLFFRYSVSFFSDRIVCNSRATKNWILRKDRNERYSVVWNGVDVLDSMRSGVGDFLIQPIMQESTSYVFSLVGRINRWKGHDLLVEAVSLIPKERLNGVRFLIVGSPPEGQESYVDDLKKCVNEKGVSDLFDFVSYSEDIRWVWQLSNVVIVPSVEPEPFGRVAIEGMAYAKPIIAAGHGGLLDIVVSGDTGILFEPRSAVDLSRAILFALNNKDLMKRMGKNGLCRARDEFTVEAYSSKMQEILGFWK